MEIIYKRELDNTYLVLEPDGEPDAFVRRIISENEPDGLLPLVIRQMDGKDKYYFRVTGLAPISRLWEKKQIRAGDIRRLLDGIKEALDVADEYLIDKKYIIPEPELIFARPDLGSVMLCCHPACPGDFFERLRHLTQYFINKADHSDKETVQASYEIFRVSGEKLCCFADIMAAAQKTADDDKKPARPQYEADYTADGVKTDFDASKDMKKNNVPVDMLKECEPETYGMLPKEDARGDDSFENWLNERGAALKKDKKSGRKIFYVPAVAIFISGICAYTLWGSLMALAVAIAGLIALIALVVVLRRKSVDGGAASDLAYDTGHDIEVKAGRGKGPLRAKADIDKSGEETCLLGDGSFGWLMICENGSKPIAVIGDTFLIGKSQDGCDLCINDNAISRTHARLENRGGVLYVTDCGSTNGTFVNGKRLVKGEPCALEEGDAIRFADITFSLARRALTSP